MKWCLYRMYMYVSRSAFAAAWMAAFFLTAALSVNAQRTQLPAHVQRMQWKVGDTLREALVYVPAAARTQPTPVIFAFHGHGGTMQNMCVTRRLDTLWPEAIFICPQGLPTPGKLTDPEGKLPGWSKTPDSTNTDIRFFDVMLQDLEKDYRIDTHRIYATGHSNGGAFTYLLWALRGNVFAAVAPTAAAGLLLRQLEPKPAFHAMGETDPLVLPFMQKRTCDYVRKLNQCRTAGDSIAPYTTLYSSDTGNPFEMYVHPGGHNYPPEITPLIAAFFKKQHR